MRVGAGPARHQPRQAVGAACGQCGDPEVYVGGVGRQDQREHLRPGSETGQLRGAGTLGIADLEGPRGSSGPGRGAAVRGLRGVRRPALPVRPVLVAAGTVLLRAGGEGVQEAFRGAQGDRVQAHPLPAQLHQLRLRFPDDLHLLLGQLGVTDRHPPPERGHRPQPDPRRGLRRGGLLALRLLGPQGGALLGPVARQQHGHALVLERRGVVGQEGAGFGGGQQPVHPGVVDRRRAHGRRQAHHGGRGFGRTGRGQVSHGPQIGDGMDRPIGLPQAGLQWPGGAHRRLEQSHHQVGVGRGEPHPDAARVQEGIEGRGDRSLGGQIRLERRPGGQGRQRGETVVGDLRRALREVGGEGGAGVGVDQGVQQLGTITLGGAPLQGGTAEPFDRHHAQVPALDQLLRLQVQQGRRQQVRHRGELLALVRGIGGQPRTGTVGHQLSDLLERALAEAGPQQLGDRLGQLGQLGARQRQGRHPPHTSAAWAEQTHPMTQLGRRCGQRMRQRGGGLLPQPGQVLRGARTPWPGLLTHPEGGAQVRVDDQVETTRCHGDQDKRRARRRSRACGRPAPCSEPLTARRHECK